MVVIAPCPSVMPDSVEERVIRATLRCIARWGVGKTTLDDVAREADVSRATVYRAFPGGKDVVLSTVVAHELQQFLDHLGGRLDGAETLEDLLVDGITETARFLTGHAALGTMLEQEPELVLVHFAFHRLDPLLAAATAFALPALARFLPEDDAAAVAEWVVRVILSYSVNPSDRVDLTDAASTRRLVTTYLLPGLRSGGHHQPKEAQHQ